VQSSTGPPLPEDIRTEEVNEIIGKIPHWIVRTGISIIGLLGLMLLVLAYFFKYPDVVPAKVTISSGNPPVKLIARNSLPIQRIFVANHQEVQARQVLCVFANSARYEDVLSAAQSVSALDTSLDMRRSVQEIVLPDHVQLGELQADYAVLYEAVQGYKFFLQNNAHDATIGTLASQAKYSSQLSAEQRQRQALQQSQLKIQQRQFEADSSLLNAKIISRMEFEEAQKKMLDQQMSVNSNKAGVIQNKIQQSEYQKDIALTSLQKQSDENTLQQKTREAIQRFNAAFALL
jgi:multidrug efflux pump subunit AcrA (membrane-fusion protein)